MVLLESVSSALAAGGFDEALPPCSLGDLAQYHPAFGRVSVSGEGVLEGTEIGMGTAAFLAEIPKKGFSPKDLAQRGRGEGNCRCDVRDCLIPAGLVVSDSDGNILRTPAADNAKYSVRRYRFQSLPNHLFVPVEDDFHSNSLPDSWYES